MYFSRVITALRVMPLLLYFLLNLNYNFQGSAEKRCGQIVVGDHDKANGLDLK